MDWDTTDPISFLEENRISRSLFAKSDEELIESSAVNYRHNALGAYALSGDRLEERLQQRAVVHVTNHGFGDFRTSSGPAPGEYGVYVGGGTFDIKDQLKRLGMRFNPTTKEWYFKHVRHPYRAIKNQPTEQQVQDVITKVYDLVGEYNKKIMQQNVHSMAAAGYPEDPEPRSKRELVKNALEVERRSKALERYGLKLTVAGKDNMGAAKLVIRGNTYPIKDLLKKVGFRFTSQKAWEMPYMEYLRISDRLERDMIKMLRQKGGNRPAPKPIEPKRPTVKQRMASRLNRLEHEELEDMVSFIESAYAV